MAAVDGAKVDPDEPQAQEPTAIVKAAQSCTAIQRFVRPATEVMFSPFNPSDEPSARTAARRLDQAVRLHFVRTR